MLDCQENQMKTLTASVFAFLALGLVVGVVAQAPAKTVVVEDPALEAILSPDAVLKTVVPGTGFFEGPTWVKGRPGYLIFSDIPHNLINKLGPDGKASVVVDNIFIGDSDKADARVLEIGAKGEKGMLTGADGTAVDSEGRITYCEYGGGRVVRVEKDGARTVLASGFEGKRFNTPNDLVYKSDGTLYFTDSGSRETKQRSNILPFTGVYRIKNGQLEVLSRDFHPNGIAFSPDEKYLYITQAQRKLVRFDVQPDGTLSNGHIWFDLNADPRPGSPDGLKTDKDGNVYTSGPGGVWIISPAGKHIGTLIAPVRSFINFTFGGDDGKTMYLTSPEALYSLPFKTSRR
jgi:gluconolactonase